MFKLDSWMNAITGLGDLARDKLASTIFQPRAIANMEYYEGIYNGDDIAAKVCDIVPEEMMRCGYSIRVADEENEYSEDHDQAKEAQDKIDQLEINSKLTDAMVWSRVFGLGALFLGVDDGRDPSLPLNENAIRRFNFVNVLDRRDLQVERYYTDPTKPQYGKPELYRVTPIEGEHRSVHESRMIIIEFVRTTARSRRYNDGFAYPLLHRLEEPIRNLGSNFASVSHLMTDASQGIFKIRNFMQLISTPQGKDALRTRMEMIDMSRSVARSLVMDADGESFERKTTQFSGLSDILDRSMLRVAGGARIPLTVMFGQQPAGLNATGEHDTRHFYDMIGSMQTSILRPILERIISLVWRSFGMQEDPDWDLVFHPLLTPTDAEAAQTRKAQAETDAIYIDRDVVLAEEIAQSRFPRNERYSFDTSIDHELRAAVLESEKERILNPPEPPAVPPPTPDAPVPGPDDTPEPPGPPTPGESTPAEPDEEEDEAA